MSASISSAMPPTSESRYAPFPIVNSMDAACSCTWRSFLAMASSLRSCCLADIGHQFEPTGFHFVPRHFEPSPGTNLFMRCAIVAAVDCGFECVKAIALQDRVNLRELQTVSVGGKLAKFRVDLIAHLRFHL